MMQVNRFSPERMINDQINLWGNIFRSTIDNISFAQEQFEKMTNVAFSGISTLQQENQRIMKEWLLNSRRGIEEFQKMTEEGISRTHEMIHSDRGNNE